MKVERTTQVRLWWMGAGVAVVALVSVLWWWAGAGGVVVLLVLAVVARAFVRLSLADQRRQGQEDLLARRFRNVLAPQSSCPMPFYYDGWNLIEERDSTGAVVATYVHGANVDEMLMMTRGGTNYFYHADALGSVTHLSDATGAVVERYAYDAFGSPTIYDSQFTVHAASPVGNRFLFTGREYLAALGLYDYRHRIYMPMIGRFLQTDPIGFAAGDVNLYRYVGNNAIDWRDPFGHDRWAVTDWIGHSYIVVDEWDEKCCKKTGGRTRIDFAPYTNFENGLNTCHTIASWMATVGFLGMWAPGHFRISDWTDISNGPPQSKTLPAAIVRHIKSDCKADKALLATAKSLNNSDPELETPYLFYFFNCRHAADALKDVGIPGKPVGLRPITGWRGGL